MGYGDELLGAGMARGLHAKGKRAAFGDGKRIIWCEKSDLIYQGNPNVAPPGSERDSDLVWIPHYRHNRLYARPVDGYWRWNKDFRAQPGEIYLTNAEREWAKQFGDGFVLIEPNVKKVAPNKQWPFDRYQIVANFLVEGRGLRLIQPWIGGDVLENVDCVEPPNFRYALALLERARLYLGPEGGLHHGAAALGKKAVVIFGGFIHPNTTGYDSHVNIFRGVEACGTIGRLCPHCVRAMDQITVSDVMTAVRSQL